MSNELKGYEIITLLDAYFYYMKIFKSIFKISSYSLAIIGTTIGAGFVSGKEISNFLSVYGNFAYLMAIIMGIVYFFTLKLFFNSSAQDPFKDNKLVNLLIGISQFISLTAMIAGLYSVFTNYFGLQPLFYFFIIVCFIIVLFGLKGLTNTNFILMPFLLVFILFVGLHGLTLNTNFGIETVSSTPTKVFTYIFLYIGLDLFSCYPICNMLGNTTTKKERNIISIIVGLTITICLICYFVSTMEKGTDYSYFDMPILNYTVNHFDFLYIFACIVITIGIFTTLISNGFVLHDITKNCFKSYSFVIFLFLFCLSYGLSFLGFSIIVEYLYPVLGVVGLILVCILIYKSKCPTSLK